MLGLHKNGSLHSREWVEEGLQRPSPLLLTCLLLLVRVQGRGVIIAFSCISTHLTPGAHSSLVVTQMALVKWVTTQRQSWDCRERTAVGGGVDRNEREKRERKQYIYL